MTMPPEVNPGSAFRAVLMDGRELLITAPADLDTGEVMLVTVPSEAVSAAKALKELAKPSGSGGTEGKLTKKEMREKAQQNALERKKRQNVYGIAYKQIEQFIIAKYGTCANGRLMGSLAGAVRAGRNAGITSSINRRARCSLRLCRRSWRICRMRRWRRPKRRRSAIESSPSR